MGVIMNKVKNLENYTITSLLDESFNKFASKKATSTFKGKTYTYLEYKNMISLYAIKLLKQGIKKGDKVAIFGEGSPEWGISYLAIISIGAVAVPLMADFNALEVESVLDHSETKTIIVSKAKLKYIDVDSLDNVFDISSGSLIKGKEEQNITYSYQFNNPNIDESDIASIIYTSGTTGKSKGVMLTHKNITFMANQLGSILEVLPSDEVLSILPLAHIYEFTIGFIVPLFKGAHITYLGKPVAVSSLLPALEEVKPTIMLTVPMIIEKVYQKKIAPLYETGAKLAPIKDNELLRKPINKLIGLKLKKTFGGRLRFFGIGGAKINPEVERFLSEASFPYAIGYGLTETSPLLAGGNAQTTRIYSAGKELLGTSLKLINVNPISKVGEIVTKGDHVMKGYYKEPKLTEEVMTDDGYFRTGDMGVFDKDNYLYITGRLKNMILGSNGENIYPENIAFVINQYPLVEESLVVEGEKGLVALIKLTPEAIKKLFVEGKELTKETTDKLIEDILKYVNSKVNKNSFIKTCKIVDEFEKTASQKIKTFLYTKKS